MLNFETEVNKDEFLSEVNSSRSSSTDNDTVINTNSSNEYMIDYNKWDLETTKLLIDLYNDVASSNQFKRKQDMWSIIAKRINDSRGYRFTGKQVQNRLGTLQRAYKKIIAKNKSGLNKIYFPFET